MEVRKRMLFINVSAFSGEDNIFLGGVIVNSSTANKQKGIQLIPFTVR